jgi:glycosidase
MFASRVASYNDNRLIATSATTATDSFKPGHPFYTAIAAMAAVRKTDPRLSRGKTLVRQSGETPGIFAFSRVLENAPGETLVVLNTATTPVTARILVDPASSRWHSLAGTCAATPAAPGSYAIALAPLSFAVCSSGTAQ